MTFSKLTAVYDLYLCCTDVLHKARNDSVEGIGTVSETLLVIHVHRPLDLGHAEQASARSRLIKGTPTRISKTQQDRLPDECLN